MTYAMNMKEVSCMFIKCHLLIFDIFYANMTLFEMCLLCHFDINRLCHDNFNLII